MNEKDNNYFDAYNETDFAKRVDEVIANPDTLDSKEKLKEYWLLALSERSKSKEFQDTIAGEAARRLGSLNFLDDIDPEYDQYKAIVFQFMNVDHMTKNYGEEADREWDKLAAMIESL